jgi:hypothetical protein
MRLPVEGEMKIVSMALAVLVFIISPAYAQSMKPRRVIVGSIRKVAETGVVKHKPFVEIELASTDAFYVGAYEWGLLIDELCLRWPQGGSSDGRSLVYRLSIDEWGKLKDRAPMYITYGGCPDASNIKLVNPFAHLSKKMLGKKPRTIEGTAWREINIPATPPHNKGMQRTRN